MALAAAAFICTASAFQSPLGMFDKPALHVSGVALRVAGRLDKMGAWGMPTGAPVQLFLRGGRPPSSRRKNAQDGVALAGGEGEDEEEVEAVPPNHHNDKVDSDQEVVNKELSLSAGWSGGPGMGGGAARDPPVPSGTLSPCTLSPPQKSMSLI